MNDQPRSKTTLVELHESAVGVNRLQTDHDVDALIEALRSDEGRGKYGQVRSWAADSLGRIGDSRAVPHLVELLTDSSAVVRQSAALALGRIGDRSAEAALTAALRDESEAVRCTAAEALGTVKAIDAVPDLYRLATSDPAIFVRIDALTSLRRLGFDDASELAAAELRTLSWWRREERRRLRPLIVPGESDRQPT